jgi:hypothetical protein
VSSVEQVSGYSIEAQTDQCREWADRQGYDVVTVTVSFVGELQLIESRRGHKKRVEFEPAIFGGLFSFVPGKA